MFKENKNQKFRLKNIDKKKIVSLKKQNKMN